MLRQDVIPGLRLRLVSLLCDREESGDGELLENRLAKLDGLSPRELREFFDGTADDLRISQLAALAGVLSADLILTVCNRRGDRDRTDHVIPALPQTDGPTDHPAVPPQRQVGSMQPGGAFSRRPVPTPAVPSPLAPPAAETIVDQPDDLLAIHGVSEALRRG